MNKNQKKAVKIYAIASTFFYEIIVIVGILFGVGYLLDEWLNTVFVFKLIFIIIGVFAGLRNVIKRVIKVESEDEE